jgi:putative transcriptional regulator
MSAMQSLQGKLLISSPALYDPNFRRTVILVAHHDEDGAMGLVLNRPAEVPVAEAAPQLTPLVDEDDPVLVGGPVSPESLMVLAEFHDPGEAAARVLGDVGFVSADAEPEALDTRRARVFAGYSGWGAGQLEAELEEGSWLIADADPEDAFAADPEALWGRVLHRMGGGFSLLATMPANPSLN